MAEPDLYVERLAMPDRVGFRLPHRRALDGRNACVGYRDALIVLLLSAAPVRMRNLASIEIGRHLVQELAAGMIYKRVVRVTRRLFGLGRRWLL